MSIDSAGNLWVAATEAGKLVKVDGNTGKATEFAPPTADSGPYSVDVDTKRNLVWFNEIFSDRIGRFDPGTNSFVEFPLPSARVRSATSK
jgi:streptogramin lyase